MNLDTIRAMSSRDAVLVAAGRRDAFEALWLLRAPYRSALGEAIALMNDAKNPYYCAGTAFVARSLEHVRSADELVVLCDGLVEDQRNHVLEAAVKGYSLDPRVLATLLEDESLMTHLAPGPIWCSDALWARATWLFQEYPGRRFTLNEIVPDTIPEGTRARAVIGAALDGARLTDEAVARVRAEYPNDAYIQQKTAPVSIEANEPDA